MPWLFDLFRSRQAVRPPNSRERAAIGQLRLLLSPTADEPLWPSKAPMEQRIMQEVLIRCALREKTGSPEQAEFCRLYVETARFQPLAEKASRDMEAIFSTRSDSPASLIDVSAQLVRAERQVLTGREILRKRLKALGLLPSKP